MELNELMKDCIIEADKNYPDADWNDTIIAAFTNYVNIVGEPLDIENEEEGMELLEKARFFLLDCVLFNMVRDGLIEIDAVAEDGELIFKIAGTIG